jgi:hypothetical protein
MANPVRFTYKFSRFIPYSQLLDDDDAHELTKMLIEVGNKIKAGPHHPNSLGVQFVQIGGDANAAAVLGKLVQADTGVRPSSSM